MTSSEFDVIITGAGPVGCAMALQLAAHAPDAGRIALRGVFDAPQQEPSPAVRTLALNQGSCALLESMGLSLHPSADILTVHVSQKGRLGRTLIEHEAHQVPRLGRVVAYAELVRSLQAAVQRSGVVLQPLTRPASDDPASQLPAHQLHIVSDGTRALHLKRDYQQHAILAVVQAGRPRPQWAFERFTREGPLALLPHPAGPALYSLVWCCPPELAQTRHTQPAEPFEAALQAQFGERLGQLTLVSERLLAPLSLHVGPQWSGGNRVVIGNAAQTLHPVAGQGLNLALRDVAQLALGLRPWLHHPDTSPAPLLQDYCQARQADRWLTVGITDLLPRVFTTGNPLIEHACGLGLLGMDLASSLRSPLSSHLLQGLRG